MTIGGKSTGKQTIVARNTWGSSKEHTTSLSKSVSIVITGLSSTATSLNYSCTPSVTDNFECPDSFSGTIVIPAY